MRIALQARLGVGLAALALTLPFTVCGVREARGGPVVRVPVVALLIGVVCAISLAMSPDGPHHHLDVLSYLIVAR